MNNVEYTSEQMIDAVKSVSNAVWKERALKAEKRLEALEYVLAYANDIVELWPTITMRTLWKMTDKVASLKDALKQSK